MVHEHEDNEWECVYFNARSNVGKADEFRAWIRDWNYNVVAKMETWLQEGHDWQLWIFKVSGVIDREVKEVEELPGMYYHGWWWRQIG